MASTPTNAAKLGRHRIATLLFSPLLARPLALLLPASACYQLDLVQANGQRGAAGIDGLSNVGVAKTDMDAIPHLQSLQKSPVSRPPAEGEDLGPSAQHTLEIPDIRQDVISILHDEVLASEPTLICGSYKYPQPMSADRGEPWSCGEPETQEMQRRTTRPPVMVGFGP